jgi:ethanolamine utilization protein EutS
MPQREIKQRIIQESVPGKQVTLCHLIAHANPSVAEKLGFKGETSAGVMTITPYEAVIIAADKAAKAADIHLVVVDRFTGSLLFTGSVSAVESALIEANRFLSDVLSFDSMGLTRS